MSDITVIGLGAMGTALAGAFIDNGFDVTVWNRTPARAEPLAARGAVHAASVAAAVEASPVSVISVLDYAAVRAVLEAAADRVDGRALINLTNGTPDQARAMAAWADDHGAGYVDGGVMVTPEMIGQAEAFILYSGSPTAYQAHEEVLRVLGHGTYVGADPARAALYDLALLSAMFGMFGGYLHAAALLRSEDIPVAEVTPMIMALLNAMIELFPETAREIDAGEYPRPSSNNTMMAAGLRNILDGSNEQHVSTELMEPVRDLFDRAVRNGAGDLDISALVPLLARDGETADARPSRM